MDTAVIVIEHTYDAPADKVWMTLTDLSKMNQWFSKLESFKVALGLEFNFSGNYSSEKSAYECVITEVIPPRKISYLFKHKDYPQPSIVTFTLFPEGEKTRLIITHSDLNNRNINIKHTNYEYTTICN